ncbi:MAG: hypothetical protein JWM99_5276 [Verrucomicrobiales bacterium]|nr:hypothetical protein [Verrucomicrobiales bacterium]
MNWKLSLSISFALLTLGTRAAIQPPEQLLPGDTVAVFTIPDWDRAVANFNLTGYGQLLSDPSMKAFNEKFNLKFTEKLLNPIDRELGVKVADYRDILHGQITFALTPHAANQEDTFGFLLLIDARGQSDLLKTNLAELKKKWTSSGQKSKADRIRDVEFTTVIFTEEDWDNLMEKAFPRPPGEEKKPGGNKKYEISFGQSDSLLIIGDNPKDIEKVIARQTGGLVPPLSEQANYQASHKALFRDASGFGWINFSPIYELLRKGLGDSAAKASSPVDINPAKILEAAGLAGLKSISFKVLVSNEGILAEAFLAAPEASRAGIFKLLAADKKAAAAPPFVTTDVMKFSRIRINGQQAWKTLEGMLSSISPQMIGFVQLALSAAGKDKDPDFDLKSTLIGNLGDDFISLEKAPRSKTAADLQSPPSILLIGSPNPEKLINGIKALTGLLPMDGATSGLKDREFQGRKIYSIQTGSGVDVEDKKAAAHSINFSAGAGYVAFSGDNALLEEFLRGNDQPGKGLKDLPGLVDASQKIGGMNNGLFTYENQAETLRTFIEAAKTDPAMLDRMIANPVGPKVPLPEGRGLREWIDVSLLPSFDKIAKYFSFSIMSGDTSAEGLTYRGFAPTPGGVKK